MNNTKDWSGILAPSGITFLKQERFNQFGQWLWSCKCGQCGKIFEALPANIMSGHVASCGCLRSSRAERWIEEVLTKANVEYQREWSTPDCADCDPLRFDFAIFRNNKLTYLIEHDGEQHFRPVSLFGGQAGYEKIKKHDQKKNEYAQLIGVPLLRLTYDQDLEEIKNILYNNIINP